jgi:hypothetical protein
MTQSQKQDPFVVLKNERLHREETGRKDLPAAQHDFGSDPLFGSCQFVVTPEDQVGYHPYALVKMIDKEMHIN